MNRRGMGMPVMNYMQPVMQHMEMQRMVSMNGPKELRYTHLDTHRSKVIAVLVLALPMQQRRRKEQQQSVQKLNEKISLCFSKSLISLI